MTPLLLFFWLPPPFLSSKFFVLSTFSQKQGSFSIESHTLGSFNLVHVPTTTIATPTLTKYIISGLGAGNSFAFSGGSWRCSALCHSFGPRTTTTVRIILILVSFLLLLFPFVLIDRLCLYVEMCILCIYFDLLVYLPFSL